MRKFSKWKPYSDACNPGRRGVSILVPHAKYAKLQNLAKELNTSVAGVAQLAVDDFLEANNLEVGEVLATKSMQETPADELFWRHQETPKK